MTSLNSFHSASEPALTALLTGLAVALLLSFCQFIGERKRRREFRDSWAHTSGGQTLQARVAAPLPPGFWSWITASPHAKAETKLFPSFPSYFLHRVKRYSFAILSVTLILVVRWLLEPVLEGSMPFSFFLAAVLFTARTQGIWETCLALILGFLLGTWFFAQPKTPGFFDHHDWWAAGIYLLIGSGIIWLLKSEQTAWLRTLNADVSVLKQIRDLHKANPVSAPATHRRELLAQIVENARDPIISVSPEGNIMTWNTAAEKLFGRLAKDAIGEPITQVLPTLRDDADWGIESRAESKALHKTFNAANGAAIEVTTTASPIKDARDQLIGVSLIVRNRTEDLVNG